MHFLERSKGEDFPFSLIPRIDCRVTDSAARFGRIKNVRLCYIRRDVDRRPAQMPNNLEAKAGVIRRDYATISEMKID